MSVLGFWARATCHAKEMYSTFSDFLHNHAVVRILYQCYQPASVSMCTRLCLTFGISHPVQEPCDGALAPEPVTFLEPHTGALLALTFCTD